MTMAHDLSYLLVDGENIDATLGISILGARPAPEQRPRWDRVRDFTARLWNAPCKPLFFLNASSGVLPATFVQALLALNYRPIPLSGAADGSVVDVAIQRTLQALRTRDGNVLLASHDGDFLPDVEALLGTDRKVAILGFREFVSASYRDLEARGLGIHDLESDAHAFNVPLPRVRIIPVDEFDPAEFL